MFLTKTSWFWFQIPRSQLLMHKKRKKNCDEMVKPFFFFFWNGNVDFIQQAKLKYNRGKVQEASKAELRRVLIAKLLEQRCGHSLPNLWGSRRPCKGSKVMSVSVVVPFQVLQFPTAKVVKGDEDSLKDVAKFSTKLLRVNGLDYGQGIRFYNDPGRAICHSRWQWCQQLWWGDTLAEIYTW